MCAPDFFDIELLNNRLNLLEMQRNIIGKCAQQLQLHFSVHRWDFAGGIGLMHETNIRSCLADNHIQLLDNSISNEEGQYRRSRGGGEGKMMVQELPNVGGGVSVERSIRMMTLQKVRGVGHEILKYLHIN
jgi:hypothetical protein